MHAQTQFTASASVGSGTLNWTVSQYYGGCGFEGQSSYTEWVYSNFSYASGGNTYPLSGSPTYFSSPGGNCPPNGAQPSELQLGGSVPVNGQNIYSVDFYPSLGGGGSGSLVQTGYLADPLYKVTSILYSPPGNESTQGYADTTTDGTTTSIGSSFSFHTELTFSSGIKNVLQGSASVGYTTSSNDSTAFTQTFTDATTLTTTDNSNSTYNPTSSDALNHNLDTFALWLNPQVTVAVDGTTPVSYNVSSQSTPGVSAIVADMITVPAVAMEALPGSVTSATPYGVSSVPPSDLNPRPLPSEVDNPQQATMPGLASICKNLNVAEYDASQCTTADQCGCTPADFAPILEQDTLLNYNSSTYTANPYAGTISPLEADASGPNICAQNPIPAGADCRYVAVPIYTGSTTPEFQTLDGSAEYSYTQTDATSTAQTTGNASGYNVGISFQVGPLISSLKTTNTWTWSDSKSTGNFNGSANTMSVTFKTSNANCNETINIYEDTVYHTSPSRYQQATQDAIELAVFMAKIPETLPL